MCGYYPSTVYENDAEWQWWGYLYSISVGSIEETEFGILPQCGDVRNATPIVSIAYISSWTNSGSHNSQSSREFLAGQLCDVIMHRCHTAEHIEYKRFESHPAEYEYI